MMQDDAIKQELTKLIGEREKPPESSVISGNVAILTIALCLSVALAAWPFVKTLLHYPPPQNISLYYKVHADPAITPAVLQDGSVDILCFAGCAHHRHAKKTIQLNENDQREI